jgi:chromosome segregation ATPase
MNKYREERDKLKAYNAELREALAEARKQRDLVAEVASEAQAEVEQLRTELEEKKGELAVAYGGGTTEPEREWFSALDKVKAEADGYKRLFKQEVAWGEEKLREVERLQRELDETAALADRLAKGYNEKHAEVNRLTAWKNAAESGGGAGVRAARAEAEVERLSAENRQRLLDAKADRDEIERLRAENDALGKMVELNVTALNKALDEAERLRKRNNDSNYYQKQQKKEITTLKGELTIERGKAERLRVDRDENAKAYAEEYARFHAEVERLQEEVTRVRGFWEDSQVKHANAASEVERLRAENQKLRAAQAEAWDEVEVQHAEVNRLTAWKNAAESGGGAGVRAARAEAAVERLTTERDALFSSAATLEGKTERLQVIEAGFRAAYEPLQGEDDWYNRRLPLIRAAQDALKEVDDEGR